MLFLYKINLYNKDSYYRFANKYRNFQIIQENVAVRKLMLNCRNKDNEWSNYSPNYFLCYCLLIEDN